MELHRGNTGCNTTPAGGKAEGACLSLGDVLFDCPCSEEVFRQDEKRSAAILG